jgi:putative ATP-dependent endonuclease of the OLD family
MITDGDPESQRFRVNIMKRGFVDADLAGRLTTLPPPNTLEDQLLADGHETLLREIMGEIGFRGMDTCTVEELRTHIKKAKTEYMAALAPRLAADATLAARMPSPFVNLIRGLRTGTI